MSSIFFQRHPPVLLFLEIDIFLASGCDRSVEVYQAFHLCCGRIGKIGPKQVSKHLTISCRQKNKQRYGIFKQRFQH